MIVKRQKEFGGVGKFLGGLTKGVKMTRRGFKTALKAEQTLAKTGKEIKEAQEARRAIESALKTAPTASLPAPGMNTVGMVDKTAKEYKALQDSALETKKTIDAAKSTEAAAKRTLGRGKSDIKKGFKTMGESVKNNKMGVAMVGAGGYFGGSYLNGKIKDATSTSSSGADPDAMVEASIVPTPKPKEEPTKIEEPVKVEKVEPKPVSNNSVPTSTIIEPKKEDSGIEDRFKKELEKRDAELADLRRQVEATNRKRDEIVKPTYYYVSDRPTPTPTEPKPLTVDEAKMELRKARRNRRADRLQAKADSLRNNTI